MCRIVCNSPRQCLDRRIPSREILRRELSKLRREYEDGGMSVTDCVHRIIEVVARFGLRPVQAQQAPEPITEDDLGVVCYQVVISE